MSLSAILDSLLDMSMEVKNFYRLVMKEIEYQKSQNMEEAWVDFPYNKYVFVCASVLKGILEDQSYKVDLDQTNQECMMTISWNKTKEENVVADPIKEVDDLALANNFEFAIDKYENIIEKTVFDISIGENKNPGIVPEMMFKIVLCALASDDIMSYKSKLDLARIYEWANNKIAFLEDLVQTVINHDTKSFTETVRKFNAISPLDTWTTTILLKIKNNISN